MTCSARITAVALALVVGISSGCAGRLPATRHADTARLDSGALGNAPYRIDIPARWNGELVMLLHGYEPKGVPRPTPWPQNDATPVFLDEGYAVAQSAYASQGWAVSDAIPDNEQLRAYFSSRYGNPRRTYLVGFSVGGHVALASLEKYGDRYDGALSLCGVNVPATRLFDDVLTSLVAFDYFFPDAVARPHGGLSDPKAPPMDQMEMIQAIGVALKSNQSSAAILSRHLEVPAEALAGVLSLHYLVLREVQEHVGGFPVDNRETIYSGFGDDAAFNQGVFRYAGDRSAMARLSDAARLTGKIGKPLLIQYNNNDPTVPSRYNLVYPELAAATGHEMRPVVLPSVGEGHCGFSPEQTWGAFERLKSWVETGRRPAGF